MPDLAGILKIEVPVIVQIAERYMTVEAVSSLTPGAIMELPKESDEELEILVNNKPIGTGTAVKVGENFGVSVTYVGDLQSRIAALAGVENAPSQTASPADVETPPTEAQTAA